MRTRLIFCACRPRAPCDSEGERPTDLPVQVRRPSGGPGAVLRAGSALDARRASSPWAAVREPQIQPNDRRTGSRSAPRNRHAQTPRLVVPSPRPEAVRRKAAHAPFKLWSSCRARHDAAALHLHRRQRLPDCRIFILTHRVRAPHRTAPFKPLGSSSMDPGDWANQTSVSRALGDRHRSAAGARPARSPLCERARTSRGSAASRVIAPAATRSPPGLPSRDGAPRPPQWRR